MNRLTNLWKQEDGFSIIEGLIAAAIILFAVIAILRMVTAGSQDVLSNKVRSVAQTQAVYGAEQVRAQDFDYLQTLYPEVGNGVTREGFASEDVEFDKIIYTIETHILAGDTNGDDQLNGFDFVIATVRVSWDRPKPVVPIEMTVYKTQ